MSAAGAPPTFEQTLRALLPETAATAAQEPLADLDYARELDLKSRALAQFLQRHGVKPAPAPVLASPRPRGYRTTTKRRVYGSARGVGLGFAQPVKPGVVLASALEPESHARLYRALQEILSRPAYAALARVARWLILRGGYERHVLILNISGIDADVARKLKLLAALLEKEALVSGALAYIDPTCSDYYLEAERPPQGLQIKHLWGDRLLGLEAEGKLLRFPPTVFSQVNESMVPPFLAQARALLQPQADDHLLDLYCGYGLFSHTLGAECRKVTGVELSAEAIRSAQAIAKRQGTAGRMTFHAARIDERFFTGKLGAPTGAEVALLDPPRQGCAPGVIKAVAARRPRRVLHVFCGTDEIPGELRQWKGAGYRVAAIRPLDMFPGTPGLETLVLLEPR
ncbi:class I SAM-dependent RNA methyltransferase [bacterium]|nr:class I SAM-dependent RNA methyltransferase [bacterium]